MITITKRFTFEASHRLNDEYLNQEKNKEIFGKCNDMPSHGHSYKLFITVSSKKLENGMVINFSDLKKIVNENVITELDHKFLNNVEWLPKLSTCEKMLIPIADRLVSVLPVGVNLRRIKLYETEDSCAEIEFEVKWNEN